MLFPYSLGCSVKNVNSAFMLCDPCGPLIFFLLVKTCLGFTETFCVKLCVIICIFVIVGMVGYDENNNSKITGRTK